MNRTPQGRFLCNYTLYTALHALAYADRRISCRLHPPPYLPSMVASHGLEEPSMDLSMIVRAAELALWARPRRLGSSGGKAKAPP